MTGLGGRFTLRDDLGLRLDPQVDAAQRVALLTDVAEGRSGQVVRLLLPSRTAAFSRRDARLPGYPAAAQAAQEHGFTPVLRPVGGRMAPYHSGCLVLDVVARSDDPRSGIDARFDAVAAVVVRALRALPGDLDVRLGPVPAEYCPGEHSVNIGGTTKVAGTAQRQVRRAALVSTLIVVDGAAPLRAVTTDVYAALGLALDPLSVGAVADHAAGTTVEAVAGALVAALAEALDLDVGVDDRAGSVAP